MVETAAYYYDGRISGKQDINLQIYEEKLCIVNPLTTGDNRTIPLNSINSIERYNNEYRIELKSIDESIPSELFVFKNDIFFHEIYSKWNKQQNVLLFLINLFSTVPLKKRIAIAVAASCICIAFFYIALINLYRFIPIKYDQYLGKKIGEQFEQYFEFCNSDKMDSFIHKAKIALSDAEDIYDYKIRVIDVPIVNAIALPGGYIYLFSGLINKCESPEEVLAIIAHEMGHIQKRHSIQQLIRNIGLTYLTTLIIGITIEGVEIFEKIEVISEIVSILILLKYSRNFEEEADQIAAKKLNQKQISVQGMINFFSRLNKYKDMSNETDNTLKDKNNSIFDFPDYLSTHPSNQKRINFFLSFKSKQQSKSSKLFDYEKRNWMRIKGSLTK